MRWLALLAAGVLAALGCSGDAGEPSDPGGVGSEATAAAAIVEPRRPAPDFRQPRLGGGEVALQALRGRIVVLDFWATWCLPCLETIPEINAFYDAHREEGIEVFGISVDEDGEEVVAEWIAKHRVRYPILLADIGLAQRFAAPGFPATYFIAPDGTMADPLLGDLDRADLEQSLARVRAYWRAVGRLDPQASPRAGRSPDS
ncbi:MAG: TlpA disulfide reductase family protein [Myxococcota bacterium]|nr:TlpA disulfide reductase family protein [Myxococcota bacterium]